VSRLPCQRRNQVTVKRPWCLFVWDAVGGWTIVHKSTTRVKVMKGWEFLRGAQHGPWAVVRVVETGKSEACVCLDCRKRRQHEHPCPECQRPVACGDAACKKATGYLCRRCSWARTGKPPTEEEVKKYGLDEHDRTLHE
jgi:hypothetical protein